MAQTAEPTLEDALAKIAADNDLTSVAVGRMPVGTRVLWTATVHWSGYAASGNACESGHSEESIRLAVEAALEKACKDRAPVAFTPPVLPALDMAEAA